MPTYVKTLKDENNNIILPRTVASYVTMADGLSTVEYELNLRPMLYEVEQLLVPINDELDEKITETEVNALLSPLEQDLLDMETVLDTFILNFNIEPVI